MLSSIFFRTIIVFNTVRYIKAPFKYIKRTTVLSTQNWEENPTFFFSKSKQALIHNSLFMLE